MDENPADLASRGAQIQSALWQQGPAWLQDKSMWPINPVTRSSPASEVEAKVIKEVLNLAQTKPEPDEFNKLLERTSLCLKSRCMDQEIHSQLQAQREETWAPTHRRKRRRMWLVDKASPTARQRNHGLL